MSLSSSLQRKAARERGEILTRTISLSEPQNVTVADKEIPIEALRERVQWLAELVRTAAQSRLVEVWEDQRVVDITAKGVPGHAHVAVGYCYGKTAWPPVGVYASDRMRRMADELSGRALRSSARRLSILDSIIPVWITREEWVQLSANERVKQTKKIWASVPSSTTQVEVSHSLRQLEEFYKREEQQPINAYEITKAPELKTALLPLDACDRQQVFIEEDKTGLVLHVKLPTRRHPRNRKDYSWHIIPLLLPEWASKKYAGWDALTPTMRITNNGRIKILLPLESPVLTSYSQHEEKPQRAFSLDWGQRTLLTGAIIEPSTEEYVTTTGKQYIFQARNAQQKMYHTRENAENLAKKTTRIEKLLKNKPNDLLTTRLEALLTEKSRQWHHLNERNKQLARTAAKWVMLTAQTEGCTLIFHEDLDNYEAKGMSRRVNGKVSMQVRSAVFEQIESLAPLYGMRVIKVPPRGTSSHDSRCGKRTRHYHAPDKPSVERPHKNWVICECKHSADRDHSAAERIGARGFQMLALINAEREAWEIRILTERKKKAEKRSRDNSPIPKRTLRSQKKIEARLRKALNTLTTPLVELKPQSKTEKRNLLTGQRPCEVVSPRSVSRGITVAERQVMVSSLSGELTQCSSFREELHHSTCELDRILLGNLGSIRFTRLPQSLRK